MAHFRNIISRRITWGDLDPVGIVFYPRFYEWMDEASHIFFDKIGLNLADLLSRRNIILALVETGAQYIRPARYHDKISIISYIEEIGDKTLLLRHEIRKEDIMLVKGYEKRICIRQKSTDKLEAISFPEDIRKVLQAYK